MQILEGNQHNIPSASFSLEGNYVATAGIDGTFRLFKRNGHEGKCKSFGPSHDWGWSVGFIDIEDLDEHDDTIDYSSTHIKFIKTEESLMSLHELIEQTVLPPPLVIYEDYLDTHQDETGLQGDLGDDYIRVPVDSYALRELISGDDESTETEPPTEDNDQVEEESEIYEDPLSELSDIEINVIPISTQPAG